MNFLGVVSLFAGLAAVIYLAFRDGVKGGGEWVIALIAGYILAVSLSAAGGLGGKEAFGLGLFFLLAAATATALLVWLKQRRRIAVTVMITYFLSVVGGLGILITTVVPSKEELFQGLLTGLLNFGLEVLLLTVALRLVAVFRHRAIQKEGERADFSVGNRILPKGNPILRTFLWADILYTGFFAVQTLVSAVSYTVRFYENYGAPVNRQDWILILYQYQPLLTYAVLFAAGYAVMLFVAGRLESAYLSSLNKADS